MFGVLVGRRALGVGFSTGKLRSDSATTHTGEVSNGELARLERLTFDSLPARVECVLCPGWGFDGSGAECRGAARLHREEVHPERRSRREVRRGRERPVAGVLVDAAELGCDVAVEGLVAARRREVVVGLRLSGESWRSIALEVGVSQSQVRKDFAAQVCTQVCTLDAVPGRVQGVDGKSYPARRRGRRRRVV